MKLSGFLRPAWNTSQDFATVLFRALGLQVVVFAFRSLRHLVVGKGYDEPTKIAIRKSRTTALMRTLIHIIPVGVAMWEIIINWNTYYLGVTIRNLAYYQFGAKVHEMTAQASLAAIVFSYIRYETSLGQGLPFGALFSGLQISQASYLWSLEFWGSICSCHLSIWRKVGMVLIISGAIVLAATVGPSSAILLIPRLDYWPAGATNIWLNATTPDMWPKRTNGTLVSRDCLVSNSMIIENNCPSSGWQAIETYISITNDLIPLNYQELYGFIPAPAFVQVIGANSLRQLRISYQPSVNSGPGLGYDNITVIATTPHVAIADALSTTGALWNVALGNVTTKGHGSVLDQLDAVHSITTGYYQPYTVASCEYDTFYGHGDQNPVAFPPPPGSPLQMLNTSGFNDSILSGYAFGSFEPTHAFIYPDITRSQVLDTSGSPNEYRLRWIELPQDPFNGTAIGAVVLLPRASENTTQEVLMCNLGAGWGTSKINMSTFGGGSQFVNSEVHLNAQEIKAEESDNGNSSAKFAPTAEEDSQSGENQFYLPVYPQIPVTVTEDWAQYLNPTISGPNTSVFHHLMTADFTVSDVATSAKVVLAGLLVNGLARIGSTSHLQGTLKTIVQPDGSEGLDGNYWFSGKGDAFIVDPIESKDWVKLRVYTTFEGFAYNTSGATPKIAICLLLAYCVFAISHTLYAGITGISSTCWDSIGEVTALAVNSTPSALLRNTCAGITELNIFKTPVRILAFRDNENSDGEHLQLVFGDLDEKSIQHQVIKENRVYGTMPSPLALKRRKTL